MVQRAVVRQLCRVCGRRTTSRAEMDEHIQEFHSGEKDPIVWLSRSEDQMEFKPCLSSTPWGKEMR